MPAGHLLLQCPQAALRMCLEAHLHCLQLSLALLSIWLLQCGQVRVPLFFKTGTTNVLLHTTAGVTTRCSDYTYIARSLLGLAETTIGPC